MEICAQNLGNSVSGDLKSKNFLGGHVPNKWTGGGGWGGGY